MFSLSSPKMNPMASLSLSLSNPISPLVELGAYEAMWASLGVWFKSLAEDFRSHPGALPSDLLANHEKALEFSREAVALLHRGGVERFGLRINGAGEYPLKLRDAEFPVELLYYRGWWDLVDTRSVAVVGSRKPSGEGIRRTEQLVRDLARDKFTIVSGLAAGIDTSAHLAAIKYGANTVGVIGTPLSETYPKQNAELQEFIARKHLLISQVPVYRYSKQDYRKNRLFFPERNITMSALTEATIIVEASDTSGTLIQARAALKQKRKLFILDSCFHRPGLKWPHTYEQRGAIRVKDYSDIRRHLIESPTDSTPAS
jgi:DNA processing protein